jgi:hypothetical protein
VPVVHTVYGSKTGICQEFDSKTIERVDKMKGVLVADLCQGRFEADRLQKYLKKNIIVLITGSKFFRGPPFSGGVLVSKSIMKELQDMGANAKVPAGLNSFIGKNEIPRELPAWREQINDNQNPALALRWAAALAEMEPTLSIPSDVRLAATANWRMAVIENIKKYQNLSYFSAAEDTPSIVSVRIKHPETGAWMVKSELSKIFLALTLDVSSKFPAEHSEVTSKICFTGQPVLISKTEAVLRIALGSDSLRNFIMNKE